MLFRPKEISILLRNSCCIKKWAYPQGHNDKIEPFGKRSTCVSWGIMICVKNFTFFNLRVRCLGCPILSQCYVASGKLDAYQCDGLYPWDAAAGTLIVREAGGCVVESSGKFIFRGFWKIRRPLWKILTFYTWSQWELA